MECLGENFTSYFETQKINIRMCLLSKSSSLFTKFDDKNWPLFNYSFPIALPKLPDLWDKGLRL